MAVAQNKLKEVEFRNFSGGINTRDWASELSGNEFPYSLNVTIDERGGAQKRLGFLDRYGASVGTGVPSNLFYWATQNKVVAQVGTGIHIDGGASIHTFSTSARVGMCEFLGNLVLIHPIDGMKIWDGATITTPTNAPVGNTCFPWQNKLWSGGDPSNPPRLYYSDIGSPNRTSATQYNDIREKDSALITCIAGGSGIDIAGRPGLLVFKQDSAYRIHDSANGAYTTIDASQGAGSNIAHIAAYGRSYVIGTRGIYSTDGLESMREESTLIETIFHKDQINQTRPDLFCAGRYQDRLFFSFPRAGQTANTTVIELHPVQKWVVPHTNAASCYASITRNVNDLVMGSPTTNRIYDSHKGGSDNGVAIASSLQTRWLEPSAGYLSRIRRLRFTGNGAFTATLLADYAVSGGTSSRNINIVSDAGTYDDLDLYDDGVMYGPTQFQGYQDEYSLGVLRAMSIQLDETSSLVKAGRSVVGGSAAPEIGAWSLSNIKVLAIDLGIY